MDFIEIMQSYFRGERIESFYYIVPAGLLLLGMAATAVISDRGSFGWGMGVPLGLVGVVVLVVGIYVGARTPGQLAELERAYEQDPAAMVAEELPRMEKVNENWPRLVATWAGLVVLGVGLRFAFKADWAHGVGPALIVVGAVGFLIDGFAERRARPYTQALESLAAEQGVGGPSPP